MKLTVRDVSKMTGLSVSTVRQYAWRMKLGSKKGTTKYFTNAEAKAVGSGNRKRGPKKSAKGAVSKGKKKPAKPAKSPARKKKK